MLLESKTIVVFGAAGLLGRTVVENILKEGANVVAVDRDEAALSVFQPLDSTRVMRVAGDIGSKASIMAILATAERAFGTVDGAVNTAYPRNGAYGAHFFDVTYDDFCENLSSHLGGYFLVMQQCADYAVKRECPFSLVNLSSIYGVVAPDFDIYAGTPMTMPVEYAAIKAGLQHLTRYVSAYVKGGFRANCVSPGGIYAAQPPEFLNKYATKCRSKGMLDPSDVIGSIVFLLSDQSAYMCGQVLVVDDGFSL